MHVSVQLSQNNLENKKTEYPEGYSVGPSGEIRTHGLMVPNHARYQLRYTRI